MKQKRHSPCQSSDGFILVKAGLFSGLLLCGLLISLSSCNRPIRLPTLQVIAGQTMGTTYSIKLFSAAGTPNLSTVSREVETELEQVNAQMSTYLSTSELSRFNSQNSDDWFPVSRETADVVELSLRLSEQTDGAFDVTVGPLVDLWGFGPDRRERSRPSAEAIADKLHSVGYEKLSVRREPPALRKSHPGLQVDLSAIAKGHGVDRVAAVLDRLGFKAFFVEIGGEVRTKGKKIEGTAWQVGVERPSQGERSVQRVLSLTDLSLATSGNYRNYYESEGRRYSHTISPKTGQPVEDAIASASVVADNCGLADGIATGMMAAGFEAGLVLAEQHGWSVMLIRPTVGGDFEIVESTEFRNRFSK